MNAPASLDRTKFNIYPVMHDVNCALWLLHPKLYKTKRGKVTVSTEPATAEEMSRLPYNLEKGEDILGHTVLTIDQSSKTSVAIGLKEPEEETANQLFDIFIRCLREQIFNR